MITLHHLENSRSQRIAWLLEELGADYEVKVYQRDPVTILAPPELKAVHPLGKSPIVSDGDVTVAESGAIIEYLLDKFTGHSLRPDAGTSEAREFTFWLHYAEGSVMPLMLMALVMHRIETAPLPFFIRPVAKGIAQKVRGNFLDDNIQRHLDFVNQTLDSRPWFAGDRFSAADIQMSYCLEAASKRADVDGKFPKIADFLMRIRGRDAYQKAESRVGSFELPSV
ncbi:MAG: glutathione S-transferase [Pseudomonadota bacterium]